MRLTIFFLLFSLNSFAQVGVGTTSPDKSAMLDVTATNKGLLIPRVVLLNQTDKKTIPNPAKSLMVWNNTVDIDAFPDGQGFYYNNGTALAPVWVSMSKPLKRIEVTISEDALSFTEPLLINKKIVEVVREGYGVPKILTAGDPYSNNVLYNKNNGNFKWNFILNKTEEIYILYYD